MQFGTRALIAVAILSRLSPLAYGASPAAFNHVHGSVDASRMARILRTAALRRCGSAGIEIAAVDSFGAAGHAVVTYRLQNITQQPCMLRGYPRVRLLDQSFSPLPTQLHQGDGYMTHERPQSVELTSGGHAVFRLEFLDVQIQVRGWACRHVPYLFVFLPITKLPIVTVSGSRAMTFTPCSPVVSVSSFHRR